MTQLSNVTHVTLDDDATVAYHCAHGDGLHSWRIEHEGSGVDAVYLVGTPEQLRALGQAMLDVPAAKEPTLSWSMDRTKAAALARTVVVD